MISRGLIVELIETFLNHCQSKIMRKLGINFQSSFRLPGIVVGFGASLVRDSAAVMIGHYFKRRRQFVEMIVMAGEGVGIALFSVILKEGVG